MRLGQLAADWSHRPADRQRALEQIGQSVLSKSRVVKSENFDRVGTDDLARMIDYYDELIFDGLCLSLARADEFTVRWSSRMTSAGGKTTRTIWKSAIGKPGKTTYEIALSSSLLFQTFSEPDEKVRVCGLPCANRLQAMQRIVEHELIHLVEMLVWIDSNCAANRFQSIANGLFLHTEHRHQLTTQRERAQKQFDIRLGDAVEFLHDGRRRRGVVNRITRRATILVEDPKGERYSNGTHYIKYYIPLRLLTRVETER